MDFAEQVQASIEARFGPNWKDRVAEASTEKLRLCRLQGRVRALQEDLELIERNLQTAIDQIKEAEE